VSILILVDGREAGRERTGAAALKTALRLEAEQNRLGRAVSTVLVDGRETADWEEALRWGTARRVELLTVPTQQLLAEAADGMLEYLPRLEEGLFAAAVCLRDGDVAGAHRFLIPAIEGLQWYVDFLRDLGSLETRCLEGVTRVAFSLRNALRAALSAWEAGDHECLSFILERKLAPEVRAGRRWLETARAELGLLN